MVPEDGFKLGRLLFAISLSFRFNFFLFKKSFLYSCLNCLKIILKMLVVPGKFYMFLPWPNARTATLKHNEH